VGRSVIGRLAATILDVQSAASAGAWTGRKAPVAQGIERYPPEVEAQVRILPGAHSYNSLAYSRFSRGWQTD